MATSSPMTTIAMTTIRATLLPDRSGPSFMTVAMIVGPLTVRTVPCRAPDPCGVVARLVTRRNLRGGRESLGTGGSRRRRAALLLRLDDVLHGVRRLVDRLLGRGTGAVHLALSLQALVSRRVADGFLQSALDLFGLVLAHRPRPFRQDALSVR